MAITLINGNQMESESLTLSLLAGTEKAKIVLVDGTNAMGAALNMGNHKITALVTGSQAGEAVEYSAWNTQNLTLASATSAEATRAGLAEAGLSSAITTETNARIAACSTLTTDLTAETNNRIAACSTITTNLGIEVQARIDADQAMQLQIDGIANGLFPKAAVACATVAPLPSSVYTDGTGTPSYPGVGATIEASDVGAMGQIDGHTLVLGERVLVKDQVAGAENGIYVLSVVGTAGAKWKLTRANDFDGAPNAEVQQNTYTYVIGGTVNLNKGLILTTANPINVGGVTPTAMVFETYQNLVKAEVLAGAGLIASTINGLETISIALAGVDGLSLAGGKLAVVPDGTSIRISSANTLEIVPGAGAAAIADHTITGIKLNSNVAGAALLYNASTNAIDVVADGSTLEINGASIRIKASGVTVNEILNATITQGKMADNSVGTNQIIASNVTAAKLAAAVAGDGIAYDNVAGLSADLGNGLAFDASAAGSKKIDVKPSTTGGTTISVTANGVQVIPDTAAGMDIGASGVKAKLTSDLKFVSGSIGIDATAAVTSHRITEVITAAADYEAGLWSFTLANILPSATNESLVDLHLNGSLMEGNANDFTLALTGGTAGKTLVTVNQKVKTGAKVIIKYWI